jgi:hypothetical protein
MENNELYLCQNGQTLSLPEALTIELMRAVFNKGACFRFQVKGFSMTPFIMDNDIVTLSPAFLPVAGLGMPVAYLCPVHKSLVLHRIVAKKGNAYLAKGDNCFQADYLMHKEDILGYVTAIERKDKKIFFSLGPERVIIAFLSRSGFLSFASFIWQLMPKFLREFIKCRMLS